MTLDISYPNFLNLPPGSADLEQAGVLIVPLPLDLTASWVRGTADGPRAIIDASHHLELYDEELGVEVVEAVGGIATHPVPELPTEPAAAAAAIAELAEAWARRDRLLVALGGEHAVTPPLVRVHRGLWPDLCVVQIDAHADARDEYMGSRHNHACPMRRVMDDGVHVTSLGIRSMDVSEVGYARSDLSRIYFAHELVGRLEERAREIVGALPAENVYLTIDLDGLDPAVVPAVGTPVPGGLGWYETLAFLRVLGRSRRIVGADVVELCPQQGLHWADAAAARLVHKLIGYSRIRPE
jgi:agmatinase